MPLKTASSKPQDWKFAWALALGALVTATGVWAYTHMSTSPDMDRPVPAWLGIPRITPQLADGRTLAVQVDLEFADPAVVQQVTPYADEFKGMMIQIAEGMNHHDLRGTRGIERYGNAIEEAVNGYLDEQHIKHKVRQVAFEEMLLTP